MTSFVYSCGKSTSFLCLLFFLFPNLYNNGNSLLPMMAKKTKNDIGINNFIYTNYIDQKEKLC